MESLRSTGSFPVAGGAAEGEKEPEEVLAWTLFLRSQLEERTGFLQEAYDTLDVRARTNGVGGHACVYLARRICVSAAYFRIYIIIIQ